MSDEKKSLSGAYGMAALALVTGVIGFPRYYLKQRLRGTLMSLLFLGGLLLVTYHYISIYIGITIQAVDALNNLGSGQTDFSQIPSLDASSISLDVRTYFGFLCLGLGGLWWFVDLFFLPSAVKKYNEEIAQLTTNRAKPGFGAQLDAEEIQRLLRKN